MRLSPMSTPLAIDLWTDGLLAEGWRVIGFDLERHVYGEARYPAQLVLQDVRTLHGRQFKDAGLILPLRVPNDELSDVVKDRCSRLKILYDSRTVAKAIDSAKFREHLKAANPLRRMS